MPVPEGFFLELEDVLNYIQKNHQTEADFAFSYGQLRMRGCRQNMVDNNDWIALRRIPVVVPSFKSLGLDGCMQMMDSWGLRPGGLILIGGSTGAGKTTTAVSLLKHYLTRYGRVAYTLESPCEFLLQGPVGQGGYCHQRLIKAESDWPAAFHGALRWNPRYVLVGEITSPTIAQHLIRHSTTQCLVIGTIHAPTVWDTINAVIQLGESSELSTSSRSYLANGLLAVIHQTLRKNQPRLDILEVPDQSQDERDPEKNKKSIRNSIINNERGVIDSKILTYANGKFLSSSNQAA
jgi:twitching motility protein PilT